MFFSVACHSLVLAYSDDTVLDTSKVLLPPKAAIIRHFERRYVAFSLTYLKGVDIVKNSLVILLPWIEYRQKMGKIPLPHALD